MERPLGYFEKKPFEAGTFYVLNAVKNNKNKNFFSVAGGGDTISLLKKEVFLTVFPLYLQVVELF